MSTVHHSSNTSDGYFATMIYDVPGDAEAIGLVGHSNDSQTSSGDFPFYDDHYFALTFLSSFVIAVECLGSRLRSELLSWKLWE